jgi:exopolyphosphatase / guanosine-5'-triphosphate,3'-diphosphate pyrophosphatase
MTRVAAVDCGTNSVRLLIADLHPDGQPGRSAPGPGGVAPGRSAAGGAGLTDVLRRMEITRLGQGVDATGRIAPQSLERTAAVLREYAADVHRLGATAVRVAATSATRDAANRADFTDLVRHLLGVEPEVITGEQEARLSFAGAVHGLPADPPYLVCDIGGGSTELVLGADTVRAAYSMDVGCVRLTERHLRGDPPSPAEIAAAEADIRDALALAARHIPRVPATFVGVAGSVTTVAALALGLAGYDSTRTHHSRLTAAQVAAVTADLLGSTHAERSARRVIHPGRVDVIGAGALILRTLMTGLGTPEVLVSEHDILDGLAFSLAPAGRRDG